MQAIITKFLGWTATKPSRITARVRHMHVTLSTSMNPGNTDVEMHSHVAELLLKKAGWTHLQLAGHGELADGRHVFTMEQKP